MGVHRHRGQRADPGRTLVHPVAVPQTQVRPAVCFRPLGSMSSMTNGYCRYRLMKRLFIID